MQADSIRAEYAAELAAALAAQAAALTGPPLPREVEWHLAARVERASLIVEALSE